MSISEYENIFRSLYRHQKNNKRDFTKYEWDLRMKIRLQIALLHKLKGDFKDADVDFEKRERLKNQALMLDRLKQSNLNLRDLRRGSVKRSPQNISPATSVFKKNLKRTKESMVV